MNVLKDAGEVDSCMEAAGLAICCGWSGRGGADRLVAGGGSGGVVGVAEEELR